MSNVSDMVDYYAHAQCQLTQTFWWRVAACATTNRK